MSFSDNTIRRLSKFVGFTTGQMVKLTARDPEQITCTVDLKYHETTFQYRLTDDGKSKTESLTAKAEGATVYEGGDFNKLARAIHFDPVICAASTPERLKKYKAEKEIEAFLLAELPGKWRARPDGIKFLHAERLEDGSEHDNMRWVARICFFDVQDQTLRDEFAVLARRGTAGAYIVAVGEDGPRVKRDTLAEAIVELDRVARERLASGPVMKRSRFGPGV